VEFSAPPERQPWGGVLAHARLEAEIVLTLLASRAEAIDLDGEPERRLNNTLRGLARLPVRVRPS
jgi:cytochrome P450